MSGKDRNPHPKSRGEQRADDRDLGLLQPITRRDLLHGASAALLGSLAKPAGAGAADADFAPEKGVGYYPPARMGLRGSHAGSFEAAHERAWNGREWPDAKPVEEPYDLVVVGGGISGLAAAYFYRQSSPDARILILDNHDDFGGHAKRNEFSHEGRRFISLGGSVFLEYYDYGDVSLGLLQDLGVDIERLREAQDPGFIFHPFGLESGLDFDRETFGRDQVLTGRFLPFIRKGPNGDYGLIPQVDAMPISESARGELKRFLTRRTDYLADVPDIKKAEALSRLSYRDFLVDRAGLPPEAAEIFRLFPAPNSGAGTDMTSVNDCLQMGMPGFRGLGEYGRVAEAEMAAYVDEIPNAHFPDGNSTIPRLLVRALIPASAPGSTMEDVVEAQFDYAKLDTPNAPVRLRLNSTAVHVDSLSKERGTSVTYIRGGRPFRVRAKNCVLACYNMMIPYLCPELPAEQKEALRYGVKTPLVSSNVLLRNGRSLQKIGAAAFYSPHRFHSLSFAFGRSLGGYEYSWDPNEPVVMHMIASAIGQSVPGLTLRDYWRLGRRQLYEMSFSDFEREIREHLGSMLGGAGFDPARDILAITVNRWPHGYAYEPSPLHDPEYPAGQAPHEIGRQRFHRIAIANSDAGAHAYVDGAIDQAHRAVRELLESAPG